MPGGRLTHQDRGDIGAGLADGLGYAEIARRLGRPTSTVSREVARNGGPAAYRVDHAHLATERRARRRTPRPPLDPSATPDAHGRDPDVVAGFAEQLAALMAGTGLPRMPARVLARLITDDSGSLTAAELVRRLRVSAASVSKAVAYLESLGVIRRVREPGRRRERYVVDDDVWLRAWTTSAQTHAQWAGIALRGVDLLDAATPAGARLAQMGGFFATLSDDMSGGPTAVDDALTVLAALLHSTAPPTADHLAAALGWPPSRVAEALRQAGPDRLSPTQRAALSSRSDSPCPAQ
ncbi:MarR family transcriptional regulator [Streptomyces sp. NBC_01381]|uniref:GbsR/MarR family transcriptional regulator n=1 Tax=Streptomyces sp. NBC_01381 TaxID=2903845 RepID=UPI00224FD43D|nr:MarR family transcriptional regulator [Streptomyces sp. NBC_01381]MCX4668861.1 MarR family transcriptional regulator [Streptomyces sp. NBC_01381]